MKRFVAVLTMLCFCTNAQAQSTEMKSGISAFNKGDYDSAILHLTAAINSHDEKDSSAHYYLASAFLHLGNRKMALQEYRASLSLAPTGQGATFCQQAIDHLTRAVATPVNKTATSGQQPGSIFPPLEGEKKSPALNIRNLPPVPAAYKDDAPAMADILSWPYVQQSSYYMTANERKNQALSRLEQAKEVLNRATSIAASAVPNARQYGESESDTKKRVDAGHTQVSEILAPYQNAVDLSQKQLEQINAICETCYGAGRRLSGY